MALGENLKSEVGKILRENWQTRQGRVVPDLDSLRMGNDAVKLDGAVLYADLDDSTELVDTMKPWFAAEVYKCYLVCAARIIRSEGGEITAYDGDRIMAVYLGDTKNTNAVRTALKINWAVQKIINPAIKSRYPNSNYSVKQVVGIDTSSLFVAREGVRGDNDLVWVGRAANYAAKLSGRNGAATQITAEVYERMNQSVRVSRDGRNMWEPATASQIGNKRIYTSTWRWEV